MGGVSDADSHCVSDGSGGWTDANSRVLIAHTATMKDCQFVFRGTQSDLLTDPGKYVDLPDKWKGPGDESSDEYNNSVTLIRSDTGEAAELTNQEY